jgi:NitT/TauT family transport system ATP-binding protein
MVTARALAKVVATRKARGQDPLTFGMTFPFSTHNYQLRFWMAAGGVDPDEDVRLVVLPPPYMVDSLANGQVDGFCVGAPWSSVAVDLGIGFILHFVSEILLRAAEKVLAVRERWAQAQPDTLVRLVRAHHRAAAFIEDEANRDEVAAILSAPSRISADAEVIDARSTAVSSAGRYGAGDVIMVGRKVRLADRFRQRGSTHRWCAGGAPLSRAARSRQGLAAPSTTPLYPQRTTRL